MHFGSVGAIQQDNVCILDVDLMFVFQFLAGSSLTD